MPRLSLRAARILAGVFLTTTVLLSVALGASWVWFDRLLLRTPAADAPPPAQMVSGEIPVSPLLVSYRLDLPGRGEIFPALASSGESWPVAVLTVSNPADRAIAQTISAEVPGWTAHDEQTLVLGPRETRALPLAPELLRAAYNSNEVRRATLKVRATGAAGEVSFAQERPVLLHSASDLYWGQRFANAQYVARWVTPHDPSVLQLVSSARRYAPDGRFRGYGATASASTASVAQQTRRQAAAIFAALRDSGLTYVSSIYTFGDFAGQAQRIRLPVETLSLRSANCIDVSVVFASAMENVGLRPVIVIVPGHAFVGVRLGPQSQETLYLDLTVLPKGTMDQAAARAQVFRRKSPPEQVLTVDIAAARTMKIYPMSPPVEPQQVAQQQATPGTREPTSEQTR